MTSASRIQNVFVLCTGRCGSVTFAKAVGHINNFTVGHESRARLMGADRAHYPLRHIEVDNRLAWFLGYLEERYGNDAFYVHLKRDRDAVAQSFNRRWHMRSSIMRAYCEAICMTSPKDPLEACYGYIDAVTSNIDAFLKDKTHVMPFEMEQHARDFPEFLQLIGAEGNLQAATALWEKKHNASIE
ncbi:hypothetical protein [Marilutibacter spongiae]|uniref:Sulfotransferase family protein n=1 Tax=Marilutibacter spongiae TaxID=2025720 RepID=A0A7W3TIP1_9GAMM|nr:hypothetical protein [Lysobacter spongiae]MBB1059035.1 hypothetical protein [Lysobacter spongiae]